MTKPDRKTPDITTLFYGRFPNANPPPPLPIPPPPESFFREAAARAETARVTPPGYKWVLVKIDDIDGR